MQDHRKRDTHSQTYIWTMFQDIILDVFHLKYIQKSLLLDTEFSNNYKASSMRKQK